MTILNIIRWIILLPLSILVAYIASVIAGIAMTLWTEPNIVGDVIVVTFRGVITALSLIFLAVKVAPSHKWVVGLILGVIYIVIMAINIYFAWIQQNYVDLWGSIVIIITLSGILINVKDNTEFMDSVRLL